MTQGSATVQVSSAEECCRLGGAGWAEKPNGKRCADPCKDPEAVEPLEEREPNANVEQHGEDNGQDPNTGTCNAPSFETPLNRAGVQFSITELNRTPLCCVLLYSAVLCCVLPCSAVLWCVVLRSAAFNKFAQFLVYYRIVHLCRAFSLINLRKSWESCCLFYFGNYSFNWTSSSKRKKISCKQI